MDFKDHEIWNEGMAIKYNPDAFITQTGMIVRWVENRRLRMTEAAMAVRETDSVLDLGCGPGNLLPMIKARRVVGVDPSDTLIAQARERVANLPHIELVKGFAETLSFPDNSFDRIVCSEVLEHVRQPELVLKEVRRVGKPGALVIITVPNENLINFAKRWVLRLGIRKWVVGKYPMSDNMLEEWHVSEVTVERLKSLAEGLDFISVTSVPFPVLAFHHIFVFSVRK